jgi:hypothetical protein
MRPRPATGTNVRFGTCPSERPPTLIDVPQWIILLLLAIVAWLVVSIGGGLVVGRLLRVASRRRGVV